MATQKLLNSSRNAVVTLLATLMGVNTLIGCSPNVTINVDSDAPTAEETPTDAGDSPASTPRVENVSANSSEAVAAEDTLPTQAIRLEELLADLPPQGVSYAQVREKLIADGWIPHTFATNGPLGDFNDPLVQQMLQQGFEEVKTCSGTGQGFCLLEFVHSARTVDGGPVLAVTTAASAPSDSPDSGPTFWDFRLDRVSDRTYANRTFDRALFNQIQEEDSFCLGVGRCEYVQYQLQDALLIGGSHDFGTVRITLIPELPMSEEEAIAIAKIFDTTESVDFTEAMVDEEANTVSYWMQNRSPDLDRGVAATLTYNLMGEVSEISYTIFVH
ncbi:MAG: hypothetical protein SWY16_26315 [Cyanobacteriota bacterium]|nr:hypothetical protein [Cyanobacteriota bacterium]